jgi:hypothetical protein
MLQSVELRTWLPRFNSWQDPMIFVFSKVALGLTQLTAHFVPWALPPGGWGEAIGMWSWLYIYAHVKWRQESWRCTSTPLHFFFKFCMLKWNLQQYYAHAFHSCGLSRNIILLCKLQLKYHLIIGLTSIVCDAAMSWFSFTVEKLLRCKPYCRYADLTA